jgi:hypothetical protein
MAATGWKWADLTVDQRTLVAEAEQTLGADYLLVYQPTQQATSSASTALLADLHAAPLTESQLECLHGLESQLQAIVVAYTGNR